jgi:hypothetical protein
VQEFAEFIELASHATLRVSFAAIGLCPEMGKDLFCSTDGDA